MGLDVRDIQNERPIRRHIKVVSAGIPGQRMLSGGCHECQTSCQSACKTSCTVGNQVCQQ